jgi:hypothetical protein
MSTPLSDLVTGFQGLVAQVPELVQPLILAAAGAIPFIEGEGGAMIGVIGGVHPLVAAVSAVVGNFLAVVLVVLLSARVRAAAVTGKARRAEASAAPVPATGVSAPGNTTAGPDAADGSGPGLTGTLTATPETTTLETTTPETALPAAKPESKGRQKLRRWLDRFGVPGASLLAPLALPTHFTAATLIAAGVSTGRVIFWQAVAIVFWAALVTAAALGLLTTVTG